MVRISIFRDRGTTRIVVGDNGKVIETQEQQVDLSIIPLIPCEDHEETLSIAKSFNMNSQPR